MGKLSRTERTGLCLLAVILAAVLGILAVRRQHPDATIETSATVPDTAAVSDTIPPVSPSVPAAPKKVKKKKQQTRKPAEPPRRHLDDTF